MLTAVQIPDTNQALGQLCGPFIGGLGIQQTESEKSCAELSPMLQLPDNWTVFILHLLAI